MPVFLFPFFLFSSLFSFLLALSHMPGASGVGPMISPVHAPLPVAAGVGPKVPRQISRRLCSIAGCPAGAGSTSTSHTTAAPMPITNRLTRMGRPMRAMAAALCWLVADGRALADGYRLVDASHFAGVADRRAGCGWDAAGYPGRGGHTYFIDLSASAAAGPHLRPTKRLHGLGRWCDCCLVSPAVPVVRLQSATGANLRLRPFWPAPSSAQTDWSAGRGCAP
jgi:hypothetical protein